MNTKDRTAPPPRAPWLAGGALLAVLLLLALLLINQLDPQARAAREALAWRQTELDQALRPVDLVAAALWRLIPPVLLLAGGIVGLCIAWQRWSHAAHRPQLDQAARPSRRPAALPSAPPAPSTDTIHDTPPDHVPTGSTPAPISAPTAPISVPAPSVPAPIAATSAPLALPDSLALADILPQLKPGHLCYGLLPNGHPLTMTFGQAYHAIAAGDTRSGKSNYLDSLITQLHYQAHHYDLRIQIGDFKREMLATWARSRLVESVEVDPQTIAELLEQLAHGADGILARYDQFKRIGETQGRIIRNLGDFCRVTGERPRLTVAIVDELNALIEAADKRSGLASALKIVLQIGAGAGVYVLGGAQYLTAASFGRDGSKQFTTRAIFGAYDHTAARMLFGGGRLAPEHRELLTGQPGRGLIRTVGQAEPTPFQALRCDESDILAAIGLLTDDQPTMPMLATPTATPDTAPGKPPTTNGEATDAPEVATETVATSAPECDESHRTEAARAAQLFFGGKAPAEIVFTLRGIKSSQGKTYQRALDEVLQLIRDGGR
jgi:hypothetical protein